MSKLGIIAGGGSLPHRLIAAARDKGRNPFVLGISGHVDADLQTDALTKLGATDAAISTLKKAGVSEVVMAGHVRRPSLGELRPDLRTIRVFIQLGARALGDDALLRAVAGELEKDGLRVIGAQDIDAGLLTPVGQIGRVAAAGFEADIKRGIEAAHALGTLDIGQAVVVQQGIVLGVEAVEGTDKLITRCAGLKRKGPGPVLVKACKPQQDKRLDLPTVGLRTVTRVYEAGFSGIVAEAGSTLMLDREDLATAADKLGLFVMGFENVRTG